MSVLAKASWIRGSIFTLALFAGCAGNDGAETIQESIGSCGAQTWHQGTYYNVGAHVLYDGRVYVATHENPGYDPTISTWFWSPDGSCTTTNPGTSCNAQAWHQGTYYNVGAHVLYDGRVYVATHENPGYDPTISTWFWSPDGSCGATNPGTGNPGTGNPGTGNPGTGNPSTMCDAPTWHAGTFYNVGARVLYTNGRVYVATHENPGYDPTVSTWFWSPAEGCGTTNPGTGNPGTGNPGTGTPTGSGFAGVVSREQFERMFPGRNAFYTYEGLVEATRSPALAAFANTGDTATRQREAAAFLANAAHETGGLVYIEEIARAAYCQPSASCPCEPGRQYYGRGPIQLSWNFNYCAAGAYLSMDLRADPDRVARESSVAWATAIWYWMTQSGPGSMTPHNAMVNGAGFGETIRSINGSLECNGGNGTQVGARVNYFRQFVGVLGTDAGPGRIDC